MSIFFDIFGIFSAFFVAETVWGAFPGGLRGLFVVTTGVPLAASRESSEAAFSRDVSPILP